ncbi:hypothetical protein Cfor_04353 [Coptotermes formosanus]|uniref:Gustatory receptor n=1 Tax=Coptotermes formosanus TaxID=36987 RepID=A0A6L2PII6_COPFO|nr:hypothetical protein Cfor_04353 [Coptotermes formosanus]
MAPLYFVSKILGLAPYSYAQTQSGSYVVKTCSMSSILWTVTVTALMLLLFLHILLLKFLRLSPGLAASYLIVFGLQKISLLLSCVAFLLLGVTTNKSKMRIIMEMLSTIDEMLIRKKRRNVYKKEFYTLLAHILLVTSVLIYMFYSYMAEDRSFHNVLFSVYYVVTLLINSVGLIQLLFLLRILKLSFKITGEELKTLKTNPVKATAFFNFTNTLGENPRRDKQRCAIFALRSLHFKLYELGRTVNSSYGLLMLIETVHNFVSAVSLVDITIFLLDREEYVMTTVYYMCWLTYYAIKTSVLMWTSHLTCSESRKLVAALYKLLLRPDLHHCCERQIRLFVTQVINNRLQFTATGIFPLDLPTLHSIVSATTTYIIVFQQLRTS